ncbi:hypothetical protein I302_106196 [Kwoniella bestiolae CBS 10118]|uniref:Secreted protein n=1 Tax=Kwoniella bestiolae CBS 10118 TaxID=1296100 RepID=A0A1B9G391_9TREE|nr:hypothetical protein I302_05319 [Kwoniella bestiolae CBS 10118]OCF25499.1 hypothetical protein I302_05319 [Kwoniella bestiolae CBS 10118]
MFTIRFLLILISSFICIVSTCHAAPAFVPPARGNGFDNHPQRFAQKPTSPQQASASPDMSNAMRLARGLPLNKPEKLYRSDITRPLQPRQSKRYADA